MCWLFCLPRYSDRSDYEDDEAAPSLSSPPPEDDEAAPSSSSPPPVKEDGFYDVFLSFRGPDTRNGFTGHLYHAMQDKGIHTFIDSENLEKGKKMDELFGNIERSKIFVPIFSKGYADSEWCLKEISKMVECKRLIIPVFFDVEPTVVRHQSGLFAPAFKRYHKNKKIDKEEVRKWRNALTEAGKVSGYVLASTNGSEATLIKLIVKRILTEVNKTPLFVAKHLVGLDSRVAELVEVLKVEAQNDVKIVGIHGMGGIGKTTLTKAVYNQIFPHFDACSFISNVREAAKQSSGLVSLQELLLRDVFKDNEVKVNNIDHGISMIKHQIMSKKVLLVLDDVDSKPQLDALAGGVDWFCSGSRIIVTTRDKRVLIGPLRVENVYELKVLDDIQSLQLFCWHAFGKEEPLPESAELSKKVADTAAGLPLALEIFGSHFFCLETNKEREDMLKKLKKNQNKDIHEKLKISFDALDEDEKTVFLDISCFFIGKDREFATFKWKDICPDLTIKFLMHKSLININETTGQFEMHDHIRDMGRKIVEDENPSDPGMRSRLWKRDDILDVLENKRGTEKIEAIDISCLWNESVDVDAKSFAEMSQLRMLRLGTVRLGGEYGDFPRTLKWLKWQSRYLDVLPSTLPLENIVVLDLSASSMTQEWNHLGFKEAKVFGQLKVLNLFKCWNLTICPDFKCMPYIEKLNLNRCTKLTELHPSIGHLKSLTHLSLKRCQSLKELPEGVWQLISLEELDVSLCYQITTLSSELMDSESLKRPLLDKLKVMNLNLCRNLTICPDFTCMSYIEKLDFSECEKLTELHPSIGHLKSSTHLYLEGCESLKELPEGVWQLTSLEALDIRGCSQITTLPSQLGNSRQLKQLHLDGTIITALPESMRELKQLNHLSLNECRLLKEIPEWIHSCISLEKLEAQNCASLASLPNALGNLRSLRKLDLSRTAIKELPCSFTSLEKLECLLVAGCERLKFLPQLTPSLTILDASCCSELEVIADVSNAEKLQKMDLSGCKNLVDVLGIEQLRHLKTLTLEDVEAFPTLSGEEFRKQTFIFWRASPSLEASTSGQMHHPTK